MQVIGGDGFWVTLRQEYFSCPPQHPPPHTLTLISGGAEGISNEQY